MTDPAPLTLAEVLSVEWLEMALTDDLRGGRITDIHVVEKIKVAATKVRLSIDIEGGPARSLHLCIKGFFDEPEFNEGRARNSSTEARFYAEIAPGSGMRSVATPYVGVNPSTGHGVVVMQDVVAAGGRFLSVLEPYSPQQVAANLEQLAHLHASHWGEPCLELFPWLTRRAALMAEKPHVSQEVLQALMDAERGQLLPAPVRDAGRILAGLRAVADRVRDNPACLVHGDCHAGNVFELDGRTTFADWQVLQCGSWALDVSYHLGVALSVEDRRAHEPDLLGHYLGSLRKLGVDAPGFGDAWNEYKMNIAYGYYLWAITRGVAPVITHEMVRRLGLAAHDHDTFGLLGV